MTTEITFVGPYPPSHPLPHSLPHTGVSIITHQRDLLLLLYHRFLVTGHRLELVIPVEMSSQRVIVH